MCVDKEVFALTSPVELVDGLRLLFVSSIPSWRLTLCPFFKGCFVILYSTIHGLDCVIESQ